MLCRGRPPGTSPDFLFVSSLTSLGDTPAIPRSSIRTITHVEDALHLSTKISMAWCVNDVDLDALRPTSLPLLTAIKSQKLSPSLDPLHSNLMQKPVVSNEKPHPCC